MTQKFRIEIGTYRCTECGRKIVVKEVPTLFNPMMDLIVREDCNNEIWHPNEDARGNGYECGPMVKE